MSGVREIVEEIRRHIHARQGTSTGGSGFEGEDVVPEVQAFDEVTVDALHGLAESYAEACLNINERAYRCQELLSKGDRKKASKIARREPDLATEAREVEFRERGLWLDICEQYQFPFPDIIDMDVVDAVIDEVYGMSQALADLLQVHRRMAIGRAPLRDRLRVLRKLCKADPTREFWKEDVYAFEARRVEELAKTAERADARGDLQGLTAVRNELSSDEWLRKPRGKLARIVEKMIEPHSRKLAIKCYERLAEDLREAHGAMDEDRCRLLMGKWYEVEHTTGSGPTDELAEAVSPIEEWLNTLQEAYEEEDAFQRTCDALDRAIDDGVAEEQIEKFSADVLRFDRGMPDLLAARVNSRVEQIRSTARRKFALILTVVIAGLLLLGGGITLGVMYYTKEKELSRWQERIAEAIGKKDGPAAATLLAELDKASPALAGEPEIVDLRAKCAQLLKAEKDRVAEFGQCLAALEAGGIEKPDSKALERAGALARTAEEKDQVEDWRQKIQRDVDAKQRKQQLAIEQRMKRLEELSTAVMDVEHKGLETVGAATNACVAFAEETLKMEGVSTLQRIRIGSIRTSAIDVEKRARGRETQEKAIESSLAGVASAAQNLGSLAAALEKFGQDYPNHAMGTEFVEAATMARYWPSVLAWKAILRTSGGGSRVTSAKAIAERKKAVEDFLKRHPDSPCAGAASRYRDYLTVGAGCLEEDGLRNLDVVARLLNAELYNNIQVLQTPDAGSFYFPKTMPPRASRIDGQIISYRVEYYVNAELATREASIPAAKVPGKLQDAPQQAFAASMVRRIDGFMGSGWETYYLTLADFAASQDMDPILRALWTKRFLEQAAKCAPFCGADIKKVVSKLEDLNVEGLAWMDPYDVNARNKRPHALRVIKAVGAVGDIAKKIDAQIGELGKCLVPYEPAGVILGGRGQVRLDTDLKAGTLHVVWTDGQGEPATFRQVGTVVDGKVSGLLKDIETYPCGTPVFVRAE